MNNFNTKYVKILEILKQFETKSNFLNQIRCPRLSDIELIAVDLTAESLSIDSEYQLFRVLPSSLSSRIERSVYNRRLCVRQAKRLLGGSLANRLRLFACRFLSVSFVGRISSGNLP